MIKKAFFIIFLIITSSLICEESIYHFSKFTPYVPDALILENSPDTSLHYKISYNLMMHNYDDAIDNFNELAPINNDSDRSTYNFFVLRILEIFNIRGDQASINKEFKKWSQVNEAAQYEQYKVKYKIAYYLYMELKLPTKKIEKRANYTLQRSEKYRNLTDTENILLLSKLLYERMDNDSLAITLIDKATPELYSFDSIVRKAKILTETNTQDAIIYLENEIEKYFLDRFEESIMLSYDVNLERAVMFLSYLNYKNNDTDSALDYFKLAIGSKKHGSTFMKNWEYWLADRDYYEDEYEVLLKLKEMIDKEVKETE